MLYHTFTGEQRGYFRGRGCVVDMEHKDVCLPNETFKADREPGCVLVDWTGPMGALEVKPKKIFNDHALQVLGE